MDESGSLIARGNKMLSCTAVDPSVSLATQQTGKQAVAVVSIMMADISFILLMGSFNHLLQRLHILSHTYFMLVCAVSRKDAFSWKTFFFYLFVFET